MMRNRLKKQNGDKVIKPPKKAGSINSDTVRRLVMKKILMGLLLVSMQHMIIGESRALPEAQPAQAVAQEPQTPKEKAKAALLEEAEDFPSMYGDFLLVR